MESNQTGATGEAGQQAGDLEKYQAFVVQQMKAGTDNWTITQKLVEMGMEQSQASQMVEGIHAEVKQLIETEQITSGAMLTGLLGGGLAAAVGGAVWGLIVILTNYEIGYMAWGIGALCGFAVVLFSGGRKGVPLQIIAILSSIVGIVIGKYILFFHLLKEFVEKEAGAEVAARVTFFSGKVFQVFIEGMREMMTLREGFFDLLWVVLAVVTAWRIPAAIGVKLQR